MSGINSRMVVWVMDACGFIVAFIKAIRMAADFELSIANLSAITGSTGKKMEVKPRVS